MTAADTTVTPFAARRYHVGHADTGRRLAADRDGDRGGADRPGQLHLHGRHAPSASATTRRDGRGLPARRARRPPSSSTGHRNAGTASDAEYFQVSAPHYNAGGGTARQWYRVDHRRLECPAGQPGLLHRQAGGRAAPGRRADRQSLRSHRSTAFRWRVTAAARARGAAARRHVLVPAAPERRRPPDALGLADRPDHAAAADRRARRRHLRHRRVPDHPGAGSRHAHPAGRPRPCRTRRRSATSTWPGRTTGRTAAPAAGFPAATLGKIYYGYPQERWVDFRQLDALKPMLDQRITMCAAQGLRRGRAG